MADIIKEMLERLPKGKISDAVFEGANIVLYTKDKDFFLDNRGLIKRVVDEFKKRVELRPDPSICLDQEKAKKVIRDIMPEESGVSEIIFDEQRSIVIVEAEKPGLAIGKQGALLREVRAKALWMPIIRRPPALRSTLIEDIRKVLYVNSDYRRKFLHKVGKRVYDGWIRGKKSEWVRVTMLGAGRQLGRSCLFLQTPESRILLDCGIDPASNNPQEAYPMLDVPEFNLQELDAVIVSSSHLEHSGFVPYLFKYGYRGPVYCTKPTRDIMSLLLLDYVKHMRSERKEPLYDVDDIKEMVKHTVCLDFEEVTDITPDIRITLYNSGFVLGSSMVHLHIGNGLHNMVYSGDMKYARSRLLEPSATHFPRLETLILEATFGSKHAIAPPAREQDARIKRVIKDTLARGGKVLLPASGSGRAQELQILIESLLRNKEIDPVPVYIDGMVWDITAIHTAYPEFMNAQVRKLILHKDQNPFLNPSFKKVENGKDRQKIVESDESCIILSSSGMLEAGPSVFYFKHLAGEKKNAVVMSSFQSDGTLGRRVKNGEKELVFKEGRKQNILSIDLQVELVDVLDHSDRKQLMNFVYKCSPRPRRVIVQQGEPGSCLDLASSIHKQNRMETTCPKNLETVRLV